MTGEALYHVYVLSMGTHNIGVEAWGDLDDADKESWEEVAKAAENYRDELEIERAEYEEQ
jgi:hypothetical protein